MEEQKNTVKKHFLDTPVGEDMGSVEFVVTEQVIQDYAEEIDDHNPWYSGKSPFGGAIAPATFICSLHMRLFTNYAMGPGSMQTGGSYEFFNPIRQGKKIKVQTKLAEKYNKRGRDYIVAETLITDEDGVQIGRTRNEHMIRPGVR